MTGLCLDLHDLAASKLAAGREKDRDFLLEMCRHEMLDPELMTARIALLPLPPREQSPLLERWKRIRDFA